MKQYALITGAGGGLGKSFALACAKKGYQLVLVDLPGTKLESLAYQIRSAYTVEVNLIFKDLSLEESVDEVQGFVHLRELVIT